MEVPSIGQDVGVGPCVSLNAVMESNSHDGLGQAVQLGLGLAFAGGPKLFRTSERAAW